MQYTTITLNRMALNSSFKPELHLAVMLKAAKKFFAGKSVCMWWPPRSFVFFLPVTVNQLVWLPSTQLQTLTLCSSSSSHLSFFLFPICFRCKQPPFSLSVISPALWLFLSHLFHSKFHYHKRGLPNQVYLKKKKCCGQFMAEKFINSCVWWNITSLLHPSYILVC